MTHKHNNAIEANRRQRASDLYWYLQRLPAARTLDHHVERVTAVEQWFAREYRLGIDHGKRKARRAKDARREAA